MKLLAFERRWLRAIFEAILPSNADDQLSLGVADVPIDRFVDDVLEHAPGQFKAGLRASLWVVALSPLFVIGRFKTFDRLDARARSEVLRCLAQSDIYLVREQPLLFKMVACLGYGGMPAVQRQIGIHPTDSSPPDWAREPERE